MEIGRNIADIAEVFIAVGEEMIFAKEMIDNEYSDIKTFWFEDSNQAKESLKEIMKKDDLVLVKGSHSMEMEKITEYIEA